MIPTLLATAFDKFLKVLPMVRGETISRKEDFGEPVYEDVGLTPRFIELIHKYTQSLEAELSEKD